FAEENPASTTCRQTGLYKKRKRIILCSDRMENVRLCFALFCVLNSWRLSLTLNCDWTTEFDHDKRCCKACPSGHYPKVPCSESKGESDCEKCPPSTNQLSKMNSCFCKEKHICSDDRCNRCEPRMKCEAGHQLKRQGNFDYSFICEPCQDNTYNDVEDSSCKPITRCYGVAEIFPGNKTHNSICYIAILPNAVNPGPQDLIPGTSPHSFQMTCLTITLLICLVVIVYASLQIFKYRTLIKLNKQCAHRTVLPTEMCSCKLSKEEKGDELESKLSEDLIKQDVLSWDRLEAGQHLEHKSFKEIEEYTVS
ncbi:hypothetical protein DNTS_009444, partial [Danionella cerebrum]